MRLNIGSILVSGKHIQIRVVVHSSEGLEVYSVGSRECSIALVANWLARRCVCYLSFTFGTGSTFVLGSAWREDTPSEMSTTRTRGIGYWSTSLTRSGAVLELVSAISSLLAPLGYILVTVIS